MYNLSIYGNHRVWDKFLYHCLGDDAKFPWYGSVLEVVRKKLQDEYRGQFDKDGFLTFVCDEDMVRFILEWS